MEMEAPFLLPSTFIRPHVYPLVTVSTRPKRKDCPEICSTHSRPKAKKKRKMFRKWASWIYYPSINTCRGCVGQQMALHIAPVCTGTLLLERYACGNPIFFLFFFSLCSAATSPLCMCGDKKDFQLITPASLSFQVDGFWIYSPSTTICIFKEKTYKGRLGNL